METRSIGVVAENRVKLLILLFENFVFEKLDLARQQKFFSLLVSEFIAKFSNLKS
jgi:hypothetical protein